MKLELMKNQWNLTSIINIDRETKLFFALAIKSQNHMNAIQNWQKKHEKLPASIAIAWFFRAYLNHICPGWVNRFCQFLVLNSIELQLERCQEIQSRRWWKYSCPRRIPQWSVPWFHYYSTTCRLHAYYYESERFFSLLHFNYCTQSFTRLLRFLWHLAHWLNSHWSPNNWKMNSKQNIDQYYWRL